MAVEQPGWVRALLAVEGAASARLDGETISLEGPVYVHADYPHEPGRLYDCPACEAVCHCAPGTAPCIRCAEQRGDAR